MLLIEQNDEWLVSRRYLSQESLAALAVPETELSGTRGPGNGAIPTGKGKGNGKGGHRPRRLRAPVTDDHELHHETRLDYGRLGSMRNHSHVYSMPACSTIRSYP